MRSQQANMVAVSTLLAFAAAANGAAHLNPHSGARSEIEARELVQRDFFSDLISFFNSLFPTTSTTTTAVITSSKTTVSSSKATGSTSITATLPASSGKPVSIAVPSSGVSKPASVVPSGSVKVSVASTGVTSIKAGTAPASSGTGVLISKAQSSASPSGTAPKSTPQASTGVASSGTAVKSTKAASGTGSSRSVSSSATPSLASPSTTLVASSSSPAPVVSSSTPTVSLSGPSASAPAGTFYGASYNGIDQFLAIPYAQPPVGPLRLKPAVGLTSSLGAYDATKPPNACPQHAQTLTGNYSAGGLQSLFDKFVFAPTPESEDCLTVNVFRPNTTSAGAKLPVVYWIFGGGFQFGSTSMFNGSDTVRKSVALGAPVIFVEVNYRVGGFGFLHGADLAAEHSTNLGLRDQRLGLQWVADNIDGFGGDPSKVTLWGESAGAISIAYQLTVNGGDNTYKGKPLFRGSIHNSGAFAPADNGTAPQAQAIYDTIVSKTGCSAATAAERLACLRSVDYEILHNATKSVPGFGTYRSADLPYLPRIDEHDPFYNYPAEYAVAAGRWTKTPFIIGDQEDEGTILAIVQNNITTNDELVDYIATWFPGDANALADVRGLAALYPDNATAGQPDGSPYGSGSSNNLYPQYKRLAAILGDIVFIITRRAFLNFGAGQGVNCWTYIATYLRGLANFGTLHGSDLAYLFDSGFSGTGPTRTIQNYYISFINYQDPNLIPTTDTATYWPTYNQTTPRLVYFGAGDTTVGNDTFRSEVYEYLLAKVTVFRV